MKLRVQPAFVVYLLSLAIISSIPVALSVFMALFIHEAGHILCCMMLSQPLEEIEFTPFGGVIRFRGTAKKGLAGAMIALAGPIANALLLYGALWLAKREIIPREMAKALLTANLGMLLINLLPVFPLDGGRFLFSIGYFLFPVSMLARFLSLLGRIVGCGILALSLIGVFSLKKLNLSLAFAGAFMLYYAGKNERALLMENQIAVLQEEAAEGEIVPVQMFEIAPDYPLIRAIEQLGRQKRIVFIVSNGKALRHFTDREMRRALLKNPMAVAQEALDENEKSI